MTLPDLSALLLTLSMTGGFGVIVASRGLLPGSREMGSRFLTTVSAASSVKSDTSRSRFEDDDDDVTGAAAAAYAAAGIHTGVT